ncbi:MAG: FHA domain-containing protein [Candidatus Woesearchaeota archaeon]
MIQPAKLTCITAGLEHIIISLNGNLPLVIGRCSQIDQPNWEGKLKAAFEGQHIPESSLHPYYFPLPLPYVSRIHALITRVKPPALQEERYYITDLDSSNGVYINGEKVGTWQLNEDNILSFGSREKGVSFRFNYEK